MPLGYPMRLNMDHMASTKSILPRASLTETVNRKLKREELIPFYNFVLYVITHPCPDIYGETDRSFKSPLK